MRIFILIMAWVYRFQIARFLGRAFRTAGDYLRRISEEKEAERARAREYAGPHGGFEGRDGRRPF